MVFSLTSSALTVFSGHAYTRRFPSVSAVTRTRGDSHCVSLGHTELAKCLPATLPGPGSELYSSPDARELQSLCSPPCTAECRVPSVGGSSGCGKSRPEGTRRAASNSDTSACFASLPSPCSTAYTTSETQL